MVEFCENNLKERVQKSVNGVSSRNSNWQRIVQWSEVEESFRTVLLSSAMTTINFTAQCFDRASTLLHISHSAAAATMAMEDKDNNIWRDRQRQSLIATFLKNQLRNFRKTTPDSVSICSRLPFSLSCLIRFRELLSSSPSMNHPRV